MLLLKRAFPFLLLIFLVSIIIRIPNLNRPISKHHEFCTAVALRIIQIWDEVGISTYDFNPVMTYPNESDKYINNYGSVTGRMVALDPMLTFDPICVRSHLSLSPRAGPPELNLSLINITPWPMKQSSPIVTSSQMKECD